MNKRIISALSLIACLCFILTACGVLEKPQDTASKVTASQEITSQEAASQNTISKNNTSKNNTSKNATSQNTTSQNTTSQNTTSQNTTSKNTTSKNTTSKNTTSKNTDFEDTPVRDETLIIEDKLKSMVSFEVKNASGKTVTISEKTVLDPNMARWAYKRELMGYVGNYDRSGNVEEEGSALLYLAIGEHQDRNAGPIRDRILKSVRNLISGDQEPGFNAGPNHSYPPVSLALAVIRHTPTVWNELNQTERAKIDLIMECFAIATSFTNDDDNYYQTGPALTGNYYKTWNPNHRLAMVIPIVASTLYFSADGNDGAAYVNNIFKKFDYDSYIAKFEKFGFDRAKYHWTAGGFEHSNGKYVPSSKELMMKGGAAYVAYGDNSETNHSKRTKLSTLADGGYGIGIKGNTFTYFGIGLDNLSGILMKLYEVTYAGGIVLSDSSLMKRGTDSNGNPLAYIADGSKSPVEGEYGMMYEFKSSDGGGFRSSSSYNTHNFVSVVQSLAVMRLLGSPVFTTKDDFIHQIWVGNTDLIYKNEVGYMDYSLGKQQGIKGEKNHPYYLPWKSWWKEIYSDAFSIY